MNPPIAELLVHRGPLLLLDAVLEADDDGLIARVVVASGQPFVTASGASALLAVEYLAQAVAAHQGTLDRAAGRAIQPGYLLAIHRLTLHDQRLALGSVWYAEVRRALMTGDGFGRYSGELRDADSRRCVVRGELTVFQSPAGLPV